MDERAREVVVAAAVCVCAGQCNRLGASFLPDWSWLWEDAGKFFFFVYGQKRERMGRGRLTYTEVWGEEEEISAWHLTDL